MTVQDCLECSELANQNVALNDEIEALNAWIADLQSGLYVNCIYCGHRYAPGVPAARDVALYSHITQCKKHPLSKALARVAELEQQQYEWAEIINSLACMVINGPNSNDLDFANDMIQMVIPYLGLS